MRWHRVSPREGSGVHVLGLGMVASSRLPFCVPLDAALLEILADPMNEIWVCSWKMFVIGALAFRQKS